VLFVPFVTEPLFELSFQLVHRHGVDVTKGMDLLNLLLRDLAKQALEQALEVLGAKCLRHGLLRLALELRLELPTHRHRQCGFAETSDSPFCFRTKFRKNPSICTGNNLEYLQTI